MQNKKKSAVQVVFDIEHQRISPEFSSSVGKLKISLGSNAPEGRGIKLGLIRKTINFLLFLLIILFILWSLVAPFIGKSNLNKDRIILLQELKNLLIETNTTDLYKACKNTNKCVVLPYFYFNGLTLVNLADFCKDRATFNKYILYKVIRFGDLWGIIELENGIKSKYFYLILSNGKIIKIKKPVLPEQEKAEYPPEFFRRDIGEIIDSLKSESPSSYKQTPSGGVTGK